MPLYVGNSKLVLVNMLIYFVHNFQWPTLLLLSLAFVCVFVISCLIHFILLFFIFGLNKWFRSINFKYCYKMNIFDYARMYYMYDVRRSVVNTFIWSLFWSDIVLMYKLLFVVYNRSIQKSIRFVCQPERPDDSSIICLTRTRINFFYFYVYRNVETLAVSNILFLFCFVVFLLLFFFPFCMFAY